MVSSARSILRQLGASDPELEDLENELNSLREENRSLQEQLETNHATASDPVDEVSVGAMVRHEAVQAAVDVAKRNSDAATRHFDRVLTILASIDGGPLEVSDITPLLDGVSNFTTHSFLKALFETWAVHREKKQKGHQYSPDRDFLERWIEVADQQVQMDKKITNERKRNR